MTSLNERGLTLEDLSETAMVLFLSNFAADSSEYNRTAASRTPFFRAEGILFEDWPGSVYSEI